MGRLHFQNRMAYETEPNNGKEIVEKSDDHNFFLPPDCVEYLRSKGNSLEPGASLTFEVVGKDSEGNVEVGYAEPDKEEDWEKDFDNSMPASVGGNQPEEY